MNDITTQEHTAEDYYLMGNQYRKTGDFSSAMNCYMEALELDPDSPAEEALHMLQDIMDFYCNDYYNP